MKINLEKLRTTRMNGKKDNAANLVVITAKSKAKHVRNEE